MTVTDRNQLPELLDLIHDHWFNVETVTLDHASKLVSFRVEPRHAALAKGSPDGVMVVIKNVDDLEIKDTEKVRDYNINEIKFDPETRTLVLTGGVPIELVFHVTDLEIHASKP